MLLLQTGSTPGGLVILNDPGQLSVTAASYGIVAAGSLTAGAGSFAALAGWSWITPTPTETSGAIETVFVALDGAGNIVGRLPCQLVSYDPYSPPFSGGGSPVQLDAVQPFYAPAKPGDSMALTNPEREATAATVLGLSNGVDTGVSLARAMMAITAFLTGKTPTYGPITKYRNWADTKDRVTMTVDPISGRLNVVFDFS